MRARRMCIWVDRTFIRPRQFPQMWIRRWGDAELVMPRWVRRLTANPQRNK